jgi:6-phosphogluconate dehydrogenase
MFVVVMGVSGSGKSTIGRLLAERLDCPFYDGDDYHPAANVAKMAAGIALDDADRAGWLAELAALIAGGLARGESGVIACSALKRQYRDVLSVDDRHVRFVYLRGEFAAIWARLQSREGHFMKAPMLQSQFEALEEPQGAIVVDTALEPGQVIDRIMEQLMDTPPALGLLGLGVMGRSLALNFARHGYPVIGYDPAPRLPPGFGVAVAGSVAELVAALAPPRVILMMVPAGAPVDAAILALRPHLSPGDVIIDGGNSYFTDTERRAAELATAGIEFVGLGVSGGESGALWGPSLMPGGSPAAWRRIRPLFEPIAAVAADGAPCVAWMGPGGAGHYVKMVHNGIEYGDMQLIAEVYDLLHRGAGLSNAELADIFDRWNDGPLRSYLIEITGHVLRRIDEKTGQSLVDVIMDIAGQKGTGRWTSQIALEVGAPTPTINAAVVMRLLSAAKTTRVAAAQRYGGPSLYDGDVAALIAAAEWALLAGKIAVYAQGMSLLQAAAVEYSWEMDLAAVVRVWRAGCIIRADLLNEIAAAYERQPQLPHLLLDERLAQMVTEAQAGWRVVVRTAAELGIPLLAVAAALGYFDALRSDRLPANLIQAQRDYFGAHTYHRIDREGVFHSDWMVGSEAL